MNIVLKIVLWILVAVIIYFAVTAGLYMPFVLKEAKKNYKDDCEYLMILGGDIIGADTPSPQLLERMKTAVVYLKENEDCYVVPCGGCFRPEQKRSEAEIIASYLIEQGIKSDRIMLEDQSTTTFENFVFAIRIIENHSGKSVNESKVAFLTSTYHMFRSSVIAQKCGINNPGKVTAPTPSDAVKRFVREYFVGYDLLIRIISKNYTG